MMIIMMMWGKNMGVNSENNNMYDKCAWVTLWLAAHLPQQGQWFVFSQWCTRSLINEYLANCGAGDGKADGCYADHLPILCGLRYIQVTYSRKTFKISSQHYVIIIIIIILNLSISLFPTYHNMHTGVPLLKVVSSFAHSCMWPSVLCYVNISWRKSLEEILLLQICPENIKIGTNITQCDMRSGNVIKLILYDVKWEMIMW